MNIEDVRAFVAVVDNGSVGKAALRLNLTQPAISRRVQRLEESLGVTLLDRISKPARPTRAGAAAYQRCLEVLRATDALTREAGTTAPRHAAARGRELRDLRMHLRAGARRAAPIVAGDLLCILLRKARRNCARRWRTARSMRRRGGVTRGTAAGRSARFDTWRRTRGGCGRQRSPTCPPPPASAISPDSPGSSIRPDVCFRTQLERALAEKGAPVNVIAETWGNALQLAMVARGVGLGLVTGTADPRLALSLAPARHRCARLPAEAFGIDGARRSAHRVRSRARRDGGRRKDRPFRDAGATAAHGLSRINPLAPRTARCYICFARNENNERVPAFLCRIF